MTWYNNNSKYDFMKTYMKLCAAAAMLPLMFMSCSKTESDAPDPTTDPTDPAINLSIDEVTVGYAKVSTAPNKLVDRYVVVLVAKNVWEMQMESYATEEDFIKYLTDNDPAIIREGKLENELIVLNGSLDFDYYMVESLIDNSGKVTGVYKHPFKSPSYTENAPEASMVIECQEITDRSVRLIHKPDVNTVGYYTLIYTKAKLEEMIRTAEEDPELKELYPDPEDYVIYFLRWEGWRWFGEEDNVWEGLEPGTEYVAVGAPFNVNGFEQGAGKLAKTPFTTSE